MDDCLYAAEGAVRIAQHLQIKKSFAAHWGTWIMVSQ